MRVGGADNSTANSYVTQRSQTDNAAFYGDRITASEGFLGATGSILKSGYTINMYDPFVAQATAFDAICQTAVASGARTNLNCGTHNQTVSYTGFTFYPSSGTITGSVSVYGYNK